MPLKGGGSTTDHVVIQYNFFLLASFVFSQCLVTVFAISIKSQRQVAGYAKIKRQMATAIVLAKYRQKKLFYYLT